MSGERGPKPAGEERPPAPGGPAAESGERLPSALERQPEWAGRLAGCRPAVFLDYDGTLTPIVNDPDAANLAPETRDTVGRLAGLCPVAVVSGRDLADVRRHVDLEGITYAGSHGFDILAPDGARHQHEAGTAALPALDRAEHVLRTAVEGIAGARLERKRFAAAVHFREVEGEASVGELERAVDRVAESEPTLVRTAGKKVLELRPAAAWDKGAAVLWILRELGLDHEDVVPIYLGDDLTDEDAFREIRSIGIGIVVAPGGRKTIARYALADPSEVREFLTRVADFLDPAGG